ncbi:ganglioside-induced differentiation-associated protein 1-like [Pecten maximus]|uniref:ganglioside-induced differentiation-associated protein 1-like n=1 Tax=Pecten maximus TaxID=6579 RepID=UPI00145832F9|nr:ganglioside-induced differentiation-associated protein 1-like [Pecten maximus]XP_033754474.1 ganglioside-induced differentiation-associated protein 1-like [Pecten maximus]
MADLKLYYFPTSFYSQKALLTLFEKETKFREQIVLLMKGEQNEPWYMKVTPKGTVPALEVPGTVLTDSEDIVNYLDKQLDTGTKLIPSTETKIGQEVEKWRKQFNALNIGVITYGTVFYPELSTTGIKVPAAIRKSLDAAKESMRNGRKTLQEKADKYPEHREDFLAKMNMHDERVGKMENKELVIQYLNELDTLFDQIESRLAETRKEQGVADSWLVGSRFTMADINLVILLDRLSFLGMEARYFTPSKRPLTYDFYVRMGKRKSVQQLREKFQSVSKIMLGRMLKKSIPVVVGVLGVLAGVFYWKGRAK